MMIISDLEIQNYHFKTNTCSYVFFGNALVRASDGWIYGRNALVRGYSNIGLLWTNFRYSLFTTGSSNSVCLLCSGHRSGLWGRNAAFVILCSRMGRLLTSLTICLEREKKKSDFPKKPLGQLGVEEWIGAGHMVWVKSSEFCVSVNKNPCHGWGCF